MSWNNRVVVNKHTQGDYTEFTASIREVFYGEKVGSTLNDIAPVGSGETSYDAIVELKKSLELMLEAVDFVLTDKTPVFDSDDVSTHIPGERSMVIRREVLDRDDDFMDEKYGEED